MSDLHPAPEEPVEAVAARVRRKLILMGLAVLAIPALYALSLSFARGRALEVAECLPPGVTLSTPLADSDATVAQALGDHEARVVNGVLVDREGRAIAFERAGAPPDRARDPRITVIRVAAQAAES